MAIAVIAAAVVGCGGSHPTAPDAVRGLTPVAMTAEWPSSAPAAEGIDPARLEDAVFRVRQGSYGRVDSLLIVRNGRLVLEEYFDGMAADRVHTQQSVTKSINSLLVGLAVGAGRLSLTDQVTRYFPQYEPLAHDDERKRAITVADLLTMRSGLDWVESTYAGSPLERMNLCGCDWLRFVLDWPMREQPGTRFEYISGGTVLLGGLVGSAVGVRLDRYAAAELFGPLGIAGESWTQGQPDGLPHAGGGLFMRPRDMLKVGTLVLQQGQWNGRQVVDASWIRLMTTRVSRGVRSWVGHAADYGYGWWMLEYQGSDVIAAAGARGQWIFAVPSRRLIVAGTGNDETNWLSQLDILFSYVLPAIPQ